MKRIVLLLALLAATGAAATTNYLSDGASLSAAVRAGSDGDVYICANGTYTTANSLNKSRGIIYATNKWGAKISGGEHPITLDAGDTAFVTNVTIDGFELTGGSGLHFSPFSDTIQRMQEVDFPSEYSSFDEFLVNIQSTLAQKYPLFYQQFPLFT